MSNNNLFVSYHHDEDEDNYKNLLVAWSFNKNDFFSDIKFNDKSIGVSINSSDASYIKRRILDKIDSCSSFLCIVGKDTFKSDWVSWEIDQAVNLNKKIAVIKIKNSYYTPDNLLGIGANFARSFNAPAIKNALD